MVRLDLDLIVIEGYIGLFILLTGSLRYTDFGAFIATTFGDVVTIDV